MTVGLLIVAGIVVGVVALVLYTNRADTDAAPAAINGNATRFAAAVARALTTTTTTTTTTAPVAVTAPQFDAIAASIYRDVDNGSLSRGIGSIGARQQRGGVEVTFEVTVSGPGGAFGGGGGTQSACRRFRVESAGLAPGDPDELDCARLLPPLTGRERFSLRDG